MIVKFYVKENEKNWSYGKVFRNWAKFLKMDVLNENTIKDGIQNSDFVISDDILAIELLKNINDVSGKKIIPYAQTLFGLNFLRSGKKGLIRRMASLIPFYITNRKYKYYMNSFKAVISNSYGTASLLHHLYNIYSTFIVHPGIDQNLYRPTKSKKNQVLVFGSSPYLNDIFDPIDKSATKNFIETSLKKNLEVHVFGRKINFDDRLIFHESISDKDLVDLYSSSLITFTPQPVELFGLVPIESMFCGTPVISTYYHDALIPGVNGYVYQRDSLDKLIDYAINLNSDEIRRSVLLNYTIEKSANNLINSLKILNGENNE
ncbi:MAG: glycosyltransferase [Candidatus Nanopusillus acidilobi]